MHNTHKYKYPLSETVWTQTYRNVCLANRSIEIDRHNIWPRSRLTYQVAVKSATTSLLPAAVSSPWKWVSSRITRTAMIDFLYWIRPKSKVGTEETGIGMGRSQEGTRGWLCRCARSHDSAHGCHKSFFVAVVHLPPKRESLLKYAYPFKYLSKNLRGKKP